MRTGRITFSATFVIFFVIAILPFLYMYASSLWVDDHLSLTNYLHVLTEGRQFILLKNSLILAASAAVMAVLIGLPYGFLVSKTDLPLRRFFFGASIVPLIIPPYVSTLGWMYLLGRRGAITLGIARLLNLTKAPFTIFSLGGCIFILSLAYFPCVTLLVASGLKSINRELEEAALVQGSQTKTLFKITLPLIIPNIVFGALLVFVLTIANFGVPAILGVNVYTVEIFSHFEAFYDFQRATATSVPLVGFCLIGFLLARFYLGSRPYSTISGHFRNPLTTKLSRGRVLALFFVSMIVGLSVVAPFVMLLIGSKSLQSYHAALETAWKQIVNSFSLAFLGATLILALSLFISYGLTRSRRLGKGILDTAVILPFIIPATVVAIGLIKLWNKPGMLGYIYGSLAIVLFGYIARFTSVSIKAHSLSLNQIRISLEEAAFLLGARWRHVLTKIIFPLTRPGISAAWILVFVLCMGELGLIVLIAPPGYETLPVRIFTLMHYGASDLVAALCVILIVITVTPAFLVYIFSYKQRSQEIPKSFA